MKTRTLIDWLGFSLPAMNDSGALLPFHDPVPWVVKEGVNRHGFAKVEVWGNVERWSQSGYAVHHYDASGRGCRDIEELGKPDGFTWPRELEYFEGLGAKWTRIDFTLDVFNVPNLMRKISQAMYRREYVTRWRKPPYEMREILPPDQQPGWTIYTGANKSDAQLIMYDKGAEQKMGPDAMPWTRIEMRLRSDTAAAMARTLITGDMRAGLEALNGYFRFVDAKGQTAPWWAEIVGTGIATTLDVEQGGGTEEAFPSGLDSRLAPLLQPTWRSKAETRITLPSFW